MESIKQLIYGVIALMLGLSFARWGVALAHPVAAMIYISIAMVSLFVAAMWFTFVVTDELFK